MRLWFLLVLAIAGAAGAEQSADLVIRNAKIVTINEQQPRAQAVAVAGERILFVGSDENVQPYIDAARTKVIDARG